MKLENITDQQKRWYDDACGMAMAMELVGERWSLLIVRELMYGPRRFGELRQSLPGISANVLTQRLEGLERANIVTRHKLPPPASVQVYDLTDWGRGSETAIQELGRWAVRSPQHDPSLPLSAASLMMSFRTMLDRTSATGLGVSIGFRLGNEEFATKLDANGLAVRRGSPEPSDLIVTAPTPMALAAVVYGGLPISEAEAQGMIAIEGDAALAARFVTLFPLPPKAF